MSFCCSPSSSDCTLAKLSLWLSSCSNEERSQGLLSASHHIHLGWGTDGRDMHIPNASVRHTWPFYANKCSNPDDFTLLLARHPTTSMVRMMRALNRSSFLLFFWTVFSSFCLGVDSHRLYQDFSVKKEEEKRETNVSLMWRLER